MWYAPENPEEQKNLQLEGVNQRIRCAVAEPFPSETVAGGVEVLYLA